MKTEGKQSVFIFSLPLILNNFQIKNSNIVKNILNHLKRHLFTNFIGFYLVDLVYLIKYMYENTDPQICSWNVISYP